MTVAVHCSSELSLLWHRCDRGAVALKIFHNASELSLLLHSGDHGAVSM